jgi:hypothetical protein
MPATEIHHLLPRSRGGKNLDAVEEIYHLIHLCRQDHSLAHARIDAYDLMIEGSVTWDKLTNRPAYRGTDPYLRRRYTPIDG